MKRHPIDYFSLITGLGFGLVAASTLANQSWFGAWNGRWIGPIILIGLGLLVLAPKRQTVAAEPAVTGVGTLDMGTIEADILAASHEELPESIIDEV